MKITKENKLPKNQLNIEIKKKILILGVNGQDGSYLAEIELKKGNIVWGIGRQSTSKWVKINSNYNYICLDLKETQKLKRVMQESSPDIIYHFAAIHGPSGFDYSMEVDQVFYINMYTVQYILEYIRENSLRTHFIYASSSKVFDFKTNIINEKSKKKNSCLYSLTKNMSHELIDFYRKNYQVSATTLWLFNHESSRRKVGYLIYKLANLINLALQNQITKPIDMGDLNFWADWGSAEEYMGIVSKISNLRNSTTNDYVIATGKTTRGYDLINNIFNAFNLEAHKYIKNNNYIFQKNSPWSADITKIKSEINDINFKKTEVVFEEIIREIIKKKSNSII